MDALRRTACRRALPEFGLTRDQLVQRYQQILAAEAARRMRGYAGVQHTNRVARDAER
ncbi:MAG TPA: hypothetical protein VET27_10105 [Mycobacterium sp.]|nr:hypothetical protein [Mycobacterium sp.]